MPARTVLLVLALIPSLAAAQDDPRLATRLAPDVRAEVEAIIDSSRTDSLPVEPLVQKALEGASKGASGPMIIAAVRALAENLRSARTALGPGSTEQELVSGAAALRAGAPETVLRELRRARTRGRLAVPLAVLTDLVAQGVPVEQAWQSVLELARTEAKDDEFLRLKQRIPGRGGPP
ncbi:MAG: hypothetical protein AB7Q69_15465 [Gemmatimonadales bacterium]